MSVQPTSEKRTVAQESGSAAVAEVARRAARSPPASSRVMGRASIRCDRPVSGRVRPPSFADLI